MFAFFFGFILGVIAAPIVTAKIWPAIKAWWATRNA